MPSYLRQKNGPFGRGNDGVSLPLSAAQYHRREDEIERLGAGCKLTVSLVTDYTLGAGASTAPGIVWSFKAAQDVYLLALEVNAFEDIGNSTVKVYYKQGSWTGTTSDSSQWTKLADTAPVLAPDSIGAIIPVADFEEVKILANEEYSLYMHSDQVKTLKVKPFSGSIGQEVNSDGVLTSLSGIDLGNDGVFGSIGGSMLAFEGTYHYRYEQPCSDSLTSSEISLEFAIDSDPVEDVMNRMSEIVGDVLAANLNSDQKLLGFKNDHLLEFNAADVKTSFRGRSDKCPQDYTSCSVVKSIATFKHLPTITQGELQLAILSMTDTLGPPIEAQHDIDTAYVGDPVISAPYSFTFGGMDIGDGLNAVQEEYFEKITTEFLAGFATIPVYTTDITDSKQISTRRSLASGLRGSRNLEASATITATIFGSGDLSNFRPEILDTFTKNSGRYIDELSLQQLKPGQINDLNAGSIFDVINSVEVGLGTSGSGNGNGNGGTTQDPDVGGPAVPGEEGTPAYIYIVAVVALLIVGFIAYKIFKRSTDNKGFQKRTLSLNDQRDRARLKQESFRTDKVHTRDRPGMGARSNSSDALCLRKQSNRQLHGINDDDRGRNRAQGGDSAGKRGRSAPGLKQLPSPTKDSPSSTFERGPLQKPTRSTSCDGLGTMQLALRNSSTDLVPAKNQAGDQRGVGRSRSVGAGPLRARRPASTRSCSREGPRPPSSARSISRERPIAPSSIRSISTERNIRSASGMSKRSGLGDIKKGLAQIGKDARAHLEDLGLVKHEVDSDDESDDSDSAELVQQPRRTRSGGGLSQMRQHLMNRSDHADEGGKNRAGQGGRGVVRAASLDAPLRKKPTRSRSGSSLEGMMKGMTGKKQGKPLSQQNDHDIDRLSRSEHSAPPPKNPAGKGGRGVVRTASLDTHPMRGKRPSRPRSSRGMSGLSHAKPQQRLTAGSHSPVKPTSTRTKRIQQTLEQAEKKLDNDLAELNNAMMSPPKRSQSLGAGSAHHKQTKSATKKKKSKVAKDSSAPAGTAKKKKKKQYKPEKTATPKRITSLPITGKKVTKKKIASPLQDSDSESDIEEHVEAVESDSDFEADLTSAPNRAKSLPARKLKPDYMSGSDSDSDYESVSEESGRFAEDLMSDESSIESALDSEDEFNA